MKSVMGIINLNEKEKDIIELTNMRPIASIPFAGRYRLIDFVISNMANSGISNIGVFLTEKPRSLVDHLGIGRPWDLDRKKDGLFILYPSGNGSSFYNNDMRNFRENIEYIEKSTQKYVIISPSYMICNIDYREAFKYHKNEEADITIIYKKIKGDKDSFQGLDTLELDSENRVVAFSKPRSEKSERNVSMETYIMKREFLLHLIYKIRGLTGKYQLRDVVKDISSDVKVQGYEFKGHLQCINSIKSYFKSSMQLLDVNVSRELFNEKSPIYTRTNDNPPTKYGKDSVVKNSLVANGAIIEGVVENSIIFRGAKVAKGAVVKNSILMYKCTVSEGTYMDHAIVDKNAVISNSKEIVGGEKDIVVIKKNSIV